MNDPVFVTEEPLSEESLSSALRRWGAGRTLICGDELLWMAAMRIVGSPDVFEQGGDPSAPLVVTPTDLVKLDDSLGGGRWGLR